jgi:hypothetical protein
MTIHLSAFCFDGDLLRLNKQQDFVAQIPPGLRNEKMLFDSLSKELQFPDYFGHNWNALWDCLCDLSWIEQRRVIILHQDLPPLVREALSIYLSILSDWVRVWEPRDAHEGVAAFPTAARERIAQLGGSEALGNGSRSGN